MSHLQRMVAWLSDELWQARLQYWGWLGPGAVVSYTLRESVAWVVFLSVYAVVDNNATKVKAITAARESVEENQVLRRQVEEIHRLLTRAQ